MPEQVQYHSNNLKKFAFLILVLEVIIIVLYGVFVRFKVSTDAASTTYYPFYQDVNVMMLIGFGFLMAFVKRHSLSALSYTFFINAIVVQLYILLSAFWLRVFHEGFYPDTFGIEISVKSFTTASYAVASVLIAFGGVLGRVGPFELLIMAMVQIVGYTFNEAVVYEAIKVFDVGGSMAIHSYGAYYGLTVSLILCRYCKPSTKSPPHYVSNIFSMIGALFLWMFWPSFNAGYFPNTEYEKNQIIANTILSLTGSCLSAFAMSAFLKNKFDMEHILNSTLAGGVIIGAPSGIIYNPTASLVIGVFGGVVSVLGYFYLTPKLEEKLDLFDTCGIHNLHGMPGVLGGILSAIVIAVYANPGSIDLTVTSDAYLQFYTQIKDGSFYAQGGLQIAGTAVSVGSGIVFGIIAGAIIRQFYDFKE